MSLNLYYDMPLFKGNGSTLNKTVSVFLDGREYFVTINEGGEVDDESAIPDRVAKIEYNNEKYGLRRVRNWNKRHEIYMTIRGLK